MENAPGTPARTPDSANTDQSRSASSSCQVTVTSSGSVMATAVVLSCDRKRLSVTYFPSLLSRSTSIDLTRPLLFYMRTIQYCSMPKRAYSARLSIQSAVTVPGDTTSTTNTASTAVGFVFHLPRGSSMHR